MLDDGGLCILLPVTCLLEGLPSALSQLLDVDRKLDVITDTVPGQLLMLPDKVMSHVGQQQHAPLMKAPLGNFSAERLVASNHPTAQEKVLTHVVHKLELSITCEHMLICHANLWANVKWQQSQLEASQQWFVAQHAGTYAMMQQQT